MDTLTFSLFANRKRFSLVRAYNVGGFIQRSVVFLEYQVAFVLEIDMELCIFLNIKISSFRYFRCFETYKCHYTNSNFLSCSKVYANSNFVVNFLFFYDFKRECSFDGFLLYFHQMHETFRINAMHYSYNIQTDFGISLFNMPSK